MKSAILIFLSVLSIKVSAQNAQIVTAYNYLSSGKLDKAKIAIDRAAAHPKTSTKSKTWRYKGDIYFAILQSKEPSYKALHPNPAAVALEAYIKAKTVDSRSKFYLKEIDGNLRYMQNINLNKGVQDFNAKRYELAIRKFKTSAAIAEHLKQKDSLAIFNIALASERALQYDQAIAYYRKCLDLDYKSASCCNFIVYILQKQKKDTEALQQVKACRAKHPDDINLLTTHINIDLKNKNFENAKTNLTKAIQSDPKNHTLHFSLGTVSENVGDQKQAKKSYEEAIRLKPDYFDATYNLGAFYFNQGVGINNKANNETDNKKYKLIRKEAEDVFKKALPYLEKARELKPNDKQTLSSLMALYARLGYTDKYKEVKALLKK